MQHCANVLGQPSFLYVYKAIYLQFVQNQVWYCPAELFMEFLEKRCLDGTISL